MKLRPYSKYKPSSIDWLGDIPEHWDIKRLGFLCLLESGENITSEVIAEGVTFQFMVAMVFEDITISIRTKGILF